jgi:molecular chaperone Hsp33
MDQLHRFLFEDLGVRGELVQLGASWRAVRDNQDYPAAVAAQLGQGLAAVMLLSGTIKFKGSLILQLQSNGPLNLLVAQATDQRTLRGLARWQAEVPAGDLAATYGEGRLVITADAPGGERYQGIVALEGTGLAEAIGNYFERSEQLPTQLWLACDGEHAAGLFLQRLPGEQVDDPDGWARIAALAETVSAEELLGLSAEQLLHRLFHEETLRLFDAEPVAYRCGCSRERIEDVLRTMGEAEVGELLEREGRIKADCEFCGREYLFDKVDAAALFAGVTAPDGDSTH